MTAGTLFADTHLPLRLWFEAMWHVVNCEERSQCVRSLSKNPAGVNADPTGDELGKQESRKHHALRVTASLPFLLSCFPDWYFNRLLGVQRVLGFGSYRTAWNWLHKLRRAMVRPGRDRLSGTVEMDEV